MSTFDEPALMNSVEVGKSIELAVNHYFKENNSRLAREICHQILKEDPKNTPALLLLGVIQFHEGDPATAERTIQSVLEIDPFYEDAREQLKQILAQKEIAYPRYYMKLREKHMGFPHSVGIETVGRCNAKCSFCPNPELDRKNTDMPDELFEKIVSDLQDIPPENPFWLFPNLINEPFMDKKIFDRLFLINEKLPNANLAIFTNLNVTPKGFFENIRSLKNLKKINVSFNAANPIEYKNTMQIDFMRTVDNIKRLMKENHKYGLLEHPVILSRIRTNSDADIFYEEECRSLFGKFKEGADYILNTKNRTNWLGTTSDDQSPIPQGQPCTAWLDINIMCTGIVPFCCMDPNGSYAIGNAYEQSVLDIYNGQRFRNIRENEMTRKNVFPCNTCSLIQ